MNMYCVKCRSKKAMTRDQVEFVTMKNGKPALKAKCPDCGTGMYKIGENLHSEFPSIEEVEAIALAKAKKETREKLLTVLESTL